MGALESNTTLVYGIHLRESANDGSDFSNGATDYRVLFLGEDGKLHVKDSAGTVTDPFTAGTDPTWTTWTPTVTQSGSVTCTVENAVYSAVGDVTHFQATLAMTASGTTNNPIVIAGQPAALQNVYTSTTTTPIIGHGLLRDEGTGYYIVNVIAYGSTAWRLITYNSTGYAGQSPNFALASGDRISITGTVRSA